jgi:hypothetical protein
MWILRFDHYRSARASTVAIVPDQSGQTMKTRLLDDKSSVHCRKHSGNVAIWDFVNQL